MPRNHLAPEWIGNINNRIIITKNHHNYVKLIYAFIGGAIVGAGAAVLFAPEKGEDVRARIADLLRKKGILCSDNEIDALVEQLTTEIDD